MTANEQKVAWIQSFMDCHASLYEVEGDLVRVNCRLACKCCTVVVEFAISDDMRIVRLEVETDEDFGSIDDSPMSRAVDIAKVAQEAVTKWNRRGK